jgi:hypothetical protein
LLIAQGQSKSGVPDAESARQRAGGSQDAIQIHVYCAGSKVSSEHDVSQVRVHGAGIGLQGRLAVGAGVRRPKPGVVKVAFLLQRDITRQGVAGDTDDSGAAGAISLSCVCRFQPCFNGDLVGVPHRLDNLGGRRWRIDDRRGVEGQRAGRPGNAACVENDQIQRRPVSGSVVNNVAAGLVELVERDQPFCNSGD